MSYEEKNAWIYGIVALAAYLAYVAILLSESSISLSDRNYIAPMLATIGGAIVVSILATIAVGIAAPRDLNKDERDRRIHRRGEYAGHAMVVAGAIGALILAMVEADYFWIANLIYLAFVLSSVVSTTVRIMAYRRGLGTW